MVITPARASSIKLSGHEMETPHQKINVKKLNYKNQNRQELRS